LRSLIKKHWKGLGLFLIVGVVIIPAIINWLFKLPAPHNFLEAEWYAADILAFYSVILGAGLAVWGIFLTIEHTQKSYRDDVKKRVLPYFVVELLSPKYTTASLTSKFSSIDNDDYEEYKIHETYFYIQRDGSLSVHLSNNDELRKIVHNCCINPILVKNVGLGTAVNFSFGTSGLNSKRIERDTFRNILPTCDAKCYILLDQQYNADLFECELAIDYCDIYKNKYSQIIPIKFERIVENGTQGFLISIDLTRLQEELS